MSEAASRHVSKVILLSDAVPSIGERVSTMMGLHESDSILEGQRVHRLCSAATPTALRENLKTGRLVPDPDRSNVPGSPTSWAGDYDYYIKPNGETWVPKGK